MASDVKFIITDKIESSVQVAVLLNIKNRVHFPLRLRESSFVLFDNYRVNGDETELFLVEI